MHPSTPTVMRAARPGVAERRQMRTRWMIAMGAAAVGAVWLLQGLGVPIGTSFMVGDPLWAVAGGLLLAGGLAVGISAWRARRSP
jgi:hypothetical protein